MAEAHGAGWLIDTAGEAGSVALGDLAGRVRAGTFFWLDIEGASHGELSDVCRSLELSPGSAADILRYPGERASFAAAGSSVHATLPWTAGTGPMASLDTSYVSFLLGELFLVTVHEKPCAPLQQARRQYEALDETSRGDGPRLLFLAVDVLISSFKPQLLALDERLGRIQLDLLGGHSPQVHDELVSILGVLTDGIQELGWYSDDLEDLAEMTDSLPIMGPDARVRFDRHRRRVTRMRDNAREQRVEAKDALEHYASIVAGRQARVINSLTIVATVFLPLSFLTGYFGMNFTVLTDDLETTLWEFLLFALLLPLACLGLSLLLIRRLQQRFRVRAGEQRPARLHPRRSAGGRAT
jgi:magnesium transporter